MIDILYLGINMGNAGYRFFCRYDQAKEDYYETFKWLIRLKKEYPKLNIAIKHHSGDYEPDKDKEEKRIIRGRIEYIDNKLNSFIFARQSKICVSYCSTMILELNGMPALAHFIYEARHHRFVIKRPCLKPECNYKNISCFRYNIPAYYLDPNGRNRQFCKYIDDVNKHDCRNCDGYNLEIFEKYRLRTYEEFKNKVKQLLDI